MHIHPTIRSFFFAILLLGLSACAQVVVGTAAEFGLAASQERSVGGAVDDFTIWSKIKNLYIQKDVNDLLVGVHVEVIEGRVHLTGSVRSASARIDAVRLAWQPEGVKEVINEIQVIQKQDVKQVAKDKWISAQVISKMLLAKDLRSVNYSVETENGIVYLMGIAQDDAELDKATQIASTVKGVQRVISHVRLRSDPSRN